MAKPAFSSSQKFGTGIDPMVTLYEKGYETLKATINRARQEIFQVLTEQKALEYSDDKLTSLLEGMREI